MRKSLIVLLFGIITLFLSCGNESSKVKFVKSPIDEIITQYIDTKNYSVILADMDHKESEDKYYHKYKILLEKEQPNLTEVQRNDTISKVEELQVIDTNWKEVSPIIFQDYIDDLGMTILSKTNGVLDKNSTPAGMSNYVGNPQYGRWRTHADGTSFWDFFLRYSFLKNVIFGSSHYGGYPRSDWEYYKINYQGKKSYYGKRKEYGTGGAYTAKSSLTEWSKKSSSFKSKVRSKVQKSVDSLKSKGYNSHKSYSKTYRNTSRYSSGSSYRGRSGGYGK